MYQELHYTNGFQSLFCSETITTDQSVYTTHKTGVTLTLKPGHLDPRRMLAETLKAPKNTVYKPMDLICKDKNDLISAFQETLNK